MLPAPQPIPTFEPRALTPAVLSVLARTPVVRAVRQALRQVPLAGQPLLLACSGGPDSTALLLAMATLTQAQSLLPHVVSVDHKLRPAAADEAQAVAELAERLGLPATVLRVDVARGPSQQAQARTARYAALAGLAERLGTMWLCLGHTRDDQAETMLMRWLSGAGTRGLAGMRHTSRLPSESASPVQLLRPLLSVSRGQINLFLQRAGSLSAPLPFIDPSNADRRYLRSRLRLDALPLLQQIAPHLDAHLLELSDQLRWDADCLDALAGQALKQLLLIQPVEAAFATSAVTVLSVPELSRLPPAIAARVLRRVAGNSLGARHVTALLHLCASTSGRKWLDLPGCGRVERRREWLLLPRRGTAESDRGSDFSPEAKTAKSAPILDGWE